MEDENINLDDFSESYKYTIEASRKAQDQAAKQMEEAMRHQVAFVKAKQQQGKEVKQRLKNLMERHQRHMAGADFEMREDDSELTSEMIHSKCFFQTEYERLKPIADEAHEVKLKLDEALDDIEAGKQLCGELEKDVKEAEKKKTEAEDKAKKATKEVSKVEERMAEKEQKFEAAKKKAKKKELELEEEVDELKSQLKKQITASQTALEIEKEKSKALQEQISSMSQIIEREREISRGFEKEMGDLKNDHDQLAAAQHDDTLLQQELARMRDERKEAKVELRELQERHGSLQRDYDALRLRLEASEVAKKETASANDTATIDLVASKAQLEALREQVASLREDLVKERQTAQEQIAQEKEVTRIQTQDLKETIREQKEDIKAANTACQKSLIDASRLEALVESLREELERAREQQMHIRDELDLSKLNESQISTKDDHSAEILVELGHLRGKTDVVSIQLAEQVKMAAASSATVTELTKALAEAKNELGHEKLEIERLKDDLDRAKMSERTATIRLDAAEANLQDAHARHEKAERRHEEESEARRNAERAHQQVQVEKNALDSAITEYQVKTENAMAELARTKLNHEAELKRLRDTRDLETAAAAEEHKRCVHDLQTKIDELEKEIVALKDEKNARRHRRTQDPSPLDAPTFDSDDEEANVDTTVLTRGGIHLDKEDTEEEIERRMLKTVAGQLSEAEKEVELLMALLIKKDLDLNEYQQRMNATKAELVKVETKLRASSEQYRKKEQSYGQLLLKYQGLENKQERVNLSLSRFFSHNLSFVEVNKSTENPFGLRVTDTGDSVKVKVEKDSITEHQLKLNSDVSFNTDEDEVLVVNNVNVWEATYDELVQKITNAKKLSVGVFKPAKLSPEPEPDIPEPELEPDISEPEPEPEQTPDIPEQEPEPEPTTDSPEPKPAKLSPDSNSQGSQAGSSVEHHQGGSAGGSGGDDDDDDDDGDGDYDGDNDDDNDYKDGANDHGRDGVDDRRITLVGHRSNSSSYGIGIVQLSDGDIVVAHLIKSELLPFKQQLRLGDRIVAVNGKNIDQLKSQAANVLHRVMSEIESKENIQLSVNRPKISPLTGGVGIVAGCTRRPTLNSEWGFTHSYHDHINNPVVTVADGFASQFLKVQDQIIRVDNLEYTFEQNEKMADYIRQSTKLIIEAKRELPNCVNLIDLPQKVKSFVFGFDIAGPKRANDGTTLVLPWIKYVDPDGSAYHQLEVGDMIFQVNGQSVKGMSHEEVCELIRAQRNLDLDVIRSAHGSSSASQINVSVFKPSSPSPIRQDPVPVPNSDGLVYVKLQKIYEDTGYGIDIAWSAKDRDRRPYIHNIVPGSTADGHLVVGDKIHYINHYNIQKLKRAEVRKLIRNDKELHLRVERQETGALVKKDNSLFVVVLTRTSRSVGFGFDVLGPDKQQSQPKVSKVEHFGPAHNDLLPGDSIISVNGQSVVGRSHKEVTRLIRAGKMVELGIQRDPSSHPVKNDNVLVITLNKRSQHESFGLDIAGAARTIHGTYSAPFVQSIIPGSVADGKLQSGDEILSVNGRSVDGQNSKTIASMTSRGHKAVFVIRRDPHMIQEGPLATLVTLHRLSKKFGYGFDLVKDLNKIYVSNVVPQSPADGLLMPGDTIVSINSMSLVNYKMKEIKSLVGAGSSVTLGIIRSALPGPTALVPHNSPAVSANEQTIALSNTPTSLLGETGSLSRMVVTLERVLPKAGFGFSFKGPDMSQGVQSMPVVTDVVPGTPAENHVVPGDRILSVNGNSVQSHSHEDVADLIQAGNSVTLEIDRDWTELQPQSHSTLIVLQRHSMDVGFGFSIGGDGLNNHLPFVSHVAPASAANGQLNCGDQIKSVNGMPVAGLSHSDIVTLINAGTLLNLGVIREHVSEHTQVAHSHSVSLTKDHGIFGFKVAHGTGPYPWIQSVTSDSAADGRLQAGDIIISVNGHNASEISQNDFSHLIQINDHLTIKLHREAEDHDNLVEVELVRGEEAQVPFGFDVMDSIGSNQYPRVIAVSNNSPAFGIIKAGDELVTVNGTAVKGFESNAITHLLQGKSKVRLGVRDAVKKLKNDSPKNVIRVAIDRPSLGHQFGFSVAGAKDGSSYPYIENVLSDSNAYNKIFEGDSVIAVNGESMFGKPNHSVVQKIREGKTVVLEIEASEHRANDSPDFNKSRVAAESTQGSTKVRLSRSHRSIGFGVSLNSNRDITHVWVQQIRPGSIADGKLQEGDFILTVNGQDVSQWSHSSVLEMLKMSKVVDLEVLRGQSEEFTVPFNEGHEFDDLDAKNAFHVDDNNLPLDSLMGDDDFTLPQFQSQERDGFFPCIVRESVGAQKLRLFGHADLILGARGITLIAENGQFPETHWALEHIKKYGDDDQVFSIEVGHVAGYLSGVYFFEMSYASHAFDHMDDLMRQAAVHNRRRW